MRVRRLTKGEKGEEREVVKKVEEERVRLPGTDLGKGEKGRIIKKGKKVKMQ